MQLWDTFSGSVGLKLWSTNSLLGISFSDPFPYEQYRRSFLRTAVHMALLLGEVHNGGALKFLSRVGITFFHRL